MIKKRGVSRRRMLYSFLLRFAFPEENAAIGPLSKTGESIMSTNEVSYMSGKLDHFHRHFRDVINKECRELCVEDKGWG